MDEKVSLDINTIRNVAANYFNINESLFDLDTQEHEIVVRRQMVHSMCCLFTDNTLYEIGKEVGGRDHATVSHSKKTINNLVDTDVSVRKWYTDLYDLFNKIREDPKYFIDRSIKNLKAAENLFKCIRGLDGIDRMLLQLHGMIITLEHEKNNKPSIDSYLVSGDTQQTNIQ
ncbi:MAG: helix-turn-helix domain-containing protein [Candidatus Paceibacterota bacterium]|jgi:hypothetical protein